MGGLTETVGAIRAPATAPAAETRELQDRLTKPRGALGVLEDVSAQLAGLAGRCPPPVPDRPAVAVFAADHGVHARGVAGWPQEVTAQMVANVCSGGAVVNAFAAQIGADVSVTDLGVVERLPRLPNLTPRRVRPGTGDITAGPAMSQEEARQALEVGIERARDLVAGGSRLLVTGDMGIANTTASAALVAVFTGHGAGEVTGRGAGVDDATYGRKIRVVRQALDLHRTDPADPLGVLAAVGGLEHAALAGLVLGGAALRVPVVLDGVTAGAAALVAAAFAPHSLAACVAGHRSAEPGHEVALHVLGLRPLADLQLRLGEGTGALLAVPVLQSAVRTLHEVRTFDSAGVTDKDPRG